MLGQEGQTNRLPATLRKEYGMQALRPKGGTKFYSPTRDLNHVMALIVKAALTNTTTALSSNPGMIEDLRGLAAGLASVMNQAKSADAGSVSMVLRDWAKESMLGDRKALSLFAINFLQAAMARYVMGIRESSDDPNLSEKDAERAMTSAVAVMKLSDGLAKSVEMEMLASGRWVSALELEGQFEVEDVKVVKDPSVLERMARAVRTNAAADGVTVDEYINKLRKEVAGETGGVPVPDVQDAGKAG